MRKKLDERLQWLLDTSMLPDRVHVIIQTVDGLTDEDREMLKRVGGVVKDDLYIINSFSAEVPGKALDVLALSPRITRIWHDTEVK